MEYAANRLLWKFSEATPPAAWHSKQAKRVYDAAMDTEKSGEWVDHAVTGSVLLDISPPENSPLSAYGTSPDIAAKRVRDRIDWLRRSADRLEAELAAYGGEGFVVRREQMRAPEHPFDAQTEILRLINIAGLRAFWIHGKKFVRNASRAFVPENAD
jgi:hypothetical protein